MAFPIQRVDRRRAQQFEQLGSKPKFWFDNDKYLFKAENRGTGEDWAEVAACRLCRLLGLPHVEYQLATECEGEIDIRPGVICSNIAVPPKLLILGNQLLLRLVPDYPHAQRFKVRQHTIDAVSDVLGTLQPPSDEWMSSAPDGLSTALDVFVGYMMLDVWIANQDRHHENWGAIWDGAESSRESLAPTFDHGAGLARLLLDSERHDRLTSRDRNRSLSVYCTKSRSAFFASAEAAQPMFLMEAYREFAARAPVAAQIWLNRLRSVTAELVYSILDEIPEQRMSLVCRRFTGELLMINRQRLLDLESFP
jgi:hypothetical protein